MGNFWSVNKRDIFIVSIYLLRLGDQTKVLKFINNISLRSYKLATILIMREKYLFLQKLTHTEELVIIKIKK